MRKTKIICTIGPATASYEMLEKLYNAGMNIARLNMSHGDHASHGQVIQYIKELNRRVTYPIAIILDTQGPEIRTCDLPQGEVELKQGDEVLMGSKGTADSSMLYIQVNYDDLVNDVAVGRKVSLDSGYINLQVLSKDAETLHCKVLDGGTLKSRRHVNLPGVKVKLPAITRKDEDDILFGLEMGIDFIAMSFVREAADVQQLKDLLKRKNSQVKVIAKIEDQLGVRNLDSILDEVHGIMIARGDLGIEINVEELPNVQRRIGRLCAEKGKRVVVATQLLESMINHPIPTRAEVSDVANAIYEEADAVMLSGETSIGKYPERCVAQLVRIIQHSEEIRGLQFARHLILHSDKAHLAVTAAQLAESLKAKGIVVMTRRGFMADHITNPRPFGVDIFAFTNQEETQRRLILNRGVYPIIVQFYDNSEDTIGDAMQYLHNNLGFKPGDKIVVFSDVVKGAQIDTLQIRYIPEEANDGF